MDVAARANVSPATVSRAFNEPDMLREPTLLRIKKAAEELGYIRDRMAGAMHRGFSGTIGLVVPTIDNAIFSQMIEAFSEGLQKHDRTMLIASHNYDLRKEVAIIRSLLERRIDGIALIGFDHDQVALNMLEQRNVPVLSIWNYSQNSKVPCVGADNFEAGSLVAKHLVGFGHKNIAIMFPHSDKNDRARARLDGVLSVLEEAGISVEPERLVNCPYDVGAAKEAAKNLIESTRPTAIICGNDIIAHGVMFAAQALGINVPDQLSVAGIGDFRSSEHTEPGLTTVRIPARRLGNMAAETLIKMSEDGVAPNPLATKVDLELKVRGSTSQVSG